MKKGVFKNSQNSQKNTCARVFFLIRLQPQACNFIKKETLVQVFSGRFCEIVKNTFFTKHLWTTASGCSRIIFHGYFCVYYLQRCQKLGCLFNVPQIFISGQQQIITVIGFVSNTSSALLPYRQVLAFSQIPCTKDII